MSRIGLMHIIDSLDAGGAERVTVNLVNHLPRSNFRVHLCTTRYDGPLAREVAEDVGRLRLSRTWRFDVGAMLRLIRYIRRHDIQLLHAHGSALFSALVANLARPHPAIVWHAHYGRYVLNCRGQFFYRLAGRRISAVIAVSESLAEWSRHRLSLPKQAIKYLPNFVCARKAPTHPWILPGATGHRIVAIANIRPEKDQLSLVRAMSRVVMTRPEAHLFLVGRASNQAYYSDVLRAISAAKLEHNVTCLNDCDDVHSVASACDIGVLSSTSEGFPLSLLEYGLAGVAAIATNVGQCSEVLDSGRAGVVVPSSQPVEMAEALLDLLNSPLKRALMSQRLRRRVQERYSPNPIIAELAAIYEDALRPRRRELRAKPIIVEKRQDAKSPA